MVSLVKWAGFLWVCISPSPHSATLSFNFLSESYRNDNSHSAGSLLGLKEMWWGNCAGPSPAPGNLTQIPSLGLQISILDGMCLLILKVVILSLVKSFKIWFPTAIDFKYHACFRKINFSFNLSCPVPHASFLRTRDENNSKRKNPAYSEGQHFQSPAGFQSYYVCLNVIHQSIGIKKKLLFNSLCMSVCLNARAVLTEATRGRRILWNWNCKRLWAIAHGSWDLNLGLLQTNVLLTAKLSLQLWAQGISSLATLCNIRSRERHQRSQGSCKLHYVRQAAARRRNFSAPFLALSIIDCIFHHSGHNIWYKQPKKERVISAHSFCKSR